MEEVPGENPRRTCNHHTERPRTFILWSSSQNHCTTLPFFPYKRNFFGFHEVRETGELTDSLSYKLALASTHIRMRWSSMSVKMAPRGKSTVFAGRIHGLWRYFHRFQDSLQLEGKLDKTWTTLRLQCFPDHDEDDEQKSFHIKIADSHEWYVKVTQKKLEET